MEIKSIYIDFIFVIINMVMIMNILLLDVGSTFIKYCIYDEEKNIINNYKYPFPKALITDGIKYEVSEKDIKDAIFKIFYFAEKENCKKAFISVQMHGYLLKNKNTFSSYISWQDRRGNISDERLRKYDFNRNGTSLKNNLPIVKLLTYNSNFFDTEFFTLGSYISYMNTAATLNTSAVHS